MNRAIIFAVLAGIVFSGLESAAETVGPLSADTHDGGHEIHGSAHANDHDHDESGDHDDHDNHFCHCGVHALAILSNDVIPLVSTVSITRARHDVSFSTLRGPPLLRPPTAS